MLQQLTQLGKEVPDWYKDFGTGEPPNWREISEDEFVSTEFFTYGFSHCEYRQFKPTRGDWFAGNLFFIGNRPEGFALAQKWMGNGYKIRYFRFEKCIHHKVEVDRAEMAELAKKFPHLKGKGAWGNCCHNVVCLKCGDYRFIDSGD